jgi:ankyrin repeat protein
VEIPVTRPAQVVWLALVMLFHGPSIVAADVPLLANAMEKQDFTTAGKLLQSRTSLNTAQADGTTALHWAVYHDERDWVRKLIQAGADVRAASQYDVTPLSLACMNGHGDIVEQLLAAGADANTVLPGGETALMTAARTGRAQAVKALLRRGAEVNRTESDGQTALMWAAAEGHLEVVEALLDAGADHQVAVRSGFTAMFFAVRQGQTDVVLRLMRAGSDVNGVMQPRARKGKEGGGGTNALLLAVENGHFELAVELLNAGADPNAHPAGYTALHAMTWVRKPIRGDGDPPPMGSGRLTSLEFVRRLVGAGADVNARLERGTSGRGRFTTTGATPFLMAARSSDVTLLRLLLELGADPAITNADAVTSTAGRDGCGCSGRRGRSRGNGSRSSGNDRTAAGSGSRYQRRRYEW